MNGAIVYIVTDMSKPRDEGVTFDDLEDAEDYAVNQTVTPDVGVFGIWQDYGGSDQAEVIALVYHMRIFEP